MNVISLLSSGNYLTVNKVIAECIGLNEAVLLGEFASEYEYWERQGQLTDGWFYSTIDNVAKNTTLSGKKQRAAINRLKNKDLIDVVVKGLPAKRYIKINEKAVEELLFVQMCRKVTTRSAETEQLRSAERSQQEVPKRNGNKNNINKNNNKNNIKIYVDEFEEIWKKYPNKKGKENALKAYINARKNNVSRETIENGIENYAKYCRNIEKKYIKHGSSWFNQKCWQDEYIDERMETAFGDNSYDSASLEMISRRRVV